MNEQQDSGVAWPVMILAHNEEAHIAVCLDSLYAAEPGRKFAIFVMANGCTDGTEAIVRKYAQTRPGVNLVSIALGDKNNAWNVFIHEVVPAQAPASDIYFFMDGDARACPRALSELVEGLRENSHAHAASSLPASGRSVRRDRDEMIRNHGLVANLYALRGDFVRQLQQKRIKLPLKLEGDDGLLGALVKWNLDPTQEWDKTRILPCPKSGFVFESFFWPNPVHWKSYWRRAVRYGRRAYEFELLGKTLKSGGIDALPADITELYPLSSRLSLRRAGLYTITNWVALRHMRKFSK